MEAKETTGEIIKGMQSGCAFLNTEGGWLFFGIHPTKLTILGQDVADRTRQEIAWEMRKFSPTIDLSAQYIDVPDRPGKQVIAIWFPAPVIYTPPYTYDGRPFYKVENTTMLMPRDIFDDRLRMSDPKKFSWEMKPCEYATLEDINTKTLTDAINEGIAKGRIPEDAALSTTTADRLRPFKVLLNDDVVTNGAIALFGKGPYVSGEVNSATVTKQSLSSHQVVAKLSLSIPTIIDLLQKMVNPMSAKDMRQFCGQKDATHFKSNVIDPLIAAGLVAMTQPDSPKSPTQRYVLTEAAQKLLS